MKPSPCDLPCAASVNLVGAVACLRVADESLNVTLKAVMPVEVGPIDAFAVVGLQAAVRTFVTMFAGLADRVRQPPVLSAAVRKIEEMNEDERNVAGTQKTALALAFAEAFVVDAIDAIDRGETDEGGDEVYERLTGAAFTLGLFRGQLESTLVRPRGDFGNN